MDADACVLLAPSPAVLRPLQLKINNKKKEQREESENKNFSKSEKLETYLMRQNILNKLFRRWTLEI